jgi:tetratricopeptide (TPR) repeat protein
MDPAILKTVGEIAGIGGISLGVVLLLFRDVIRKNIFRKLGVPEAYRLLRLIIVLVFLIGIAGLAAWVVTKRDSLPSSFTNVTNIGAIQNEFLTITGHPLNDPELKKLIEQALALTARGDAQASIPLYQQAIEKAPLPALYNNLAAAYAQHNDDQRARGALQKALAKNASYAPALKNLTALNLPRPDTDAAVRVTSRESEPNNNLFQPNIIPLNTGVLAAIEPASDVDTFQFEAPGKSRDWIDVKLENRSTTLRPSMRILQPNKEELIGWNAAGTEGADHSLAFVALPGDKYFIQVASNYNQSTGAYVLTVKPRRAFDQYEPNDDIAHATPIRMGSPVEANIMDGGDADFYRFESGSGGDITVTLENTSTTLEPAVRVLDASRSAVTGQANGNPGGHLKFSFKAEARALYYVHVAAHYANSAGSYKLTVQ